MKPEKIKDLFLLLGDIFGDDKIIHTKLLLAINDVISSEYNSVKQELSYLNN